MLLTSTSLDVHKFTAKDSDKRHAFTGVMVTQEGITVGCDGHRLVRVFPRCGKPLPDDEYPKVNHELCDPPEEGLLVPASTAKAIQKAIVKKTTLPILEHAALAKTDGPAGQAWTLLTTDLDSTKVEYFNPVDAKYPKWDKLIPDYRGPKYHRISMQAQYLKEIAAFVQANGGFEQAITLHVPEDGCTAMVLTAYANEHFIQAIQMPIRSDNPDEHNPEPEPEREEKELTTEVTLAALWKTASKMKELGMSIVEIEELIGVEIECPEAKSE